MCAGVMASTFSRDNANDIVSALSFYFVEYPYLFFL